MSHDIADEKLTYSSDGTPTYSVKLRNLNHLIRTMYNGKAVLGQTFTVENIDLCLQIYANGLNSSSRGRVSVLLANKSSFPVIVTCRFKMGDKYVEKNVLFFSYFCLQDFWSEEHYDQTIHRIWTLRIIKPQWKGIVKPLFLLHHLLLHHWPLEEQVRAEDDGDAGSSEHWTLGDKKHAGADKTGDSVKTKLANRSKDAGTECTISRGFHIFLLRRRWTSVKGY